MIRAIVALGKWLDRRFPAKVVITESDLASLKNRLDSNTQTVKMMNDHIEDLRQGFVERLNQHEESIKAIKEAMAKTATPTAAEMNRRAAFIAIGRMGE